MKFVSWNVNGLRACITKGFGDYFNAVNADVFAIQETKMQEEQKTFHFPGYHEYWSSAIKKGYSGTLIYTKETPLKVTYGIDGKYNDEGRIITLEYPTYYFVNTYVPNSQDELARLDYRMIFEDDMRMYLSHLTTLKPVIYCGDLNVAHQEIDLKNPKSNERNPGFTIEERTKFQGLLDSGFTDSFRFLHPTEIRYSWWSYRMNARANGVGWRIDYFVISNALRSQLRKSQIDDHIYGSDHCPVVLEIF
ncbi:MAG: exodeoxyribonuclease III [Bacilli bacterium]|nr:exodeoxyribonuclease III [Bacilli bacterium]